MIRFLSFICLFFLAACGSSLPDGVLPPEKMSAIQWDMMRADEMTDYYAAKDSGYPANEKRKGLYAEILRIHQVEQSVFDKSLDYYTAHPAALKEILDTLQSRGERMQRNIRDTAHTPKVLPELPHADSLIKDTFRLNKLIKRRAD